MNLKPEDGERRSFIARQKIEDKLFIIMAWFGLWICLFNTLDFLANLSTILFLTTLFASTLGSLVIADLLLYRLFYYGKIEKRGK